MKGRVAGEVGESGVGLASRSSLMGGGGLGREVRRRRASVPSPEKDLAACDVWWRGADPTLVMRRRATNPNENVVKKKGYLSILRRWKK